MLSIFEVVMGSTGVSKNVLQEIRVCFESLGDNIFRAKLTDVAGKQLGGECNFSPFLSDADYDSLRWYLEEYMDLPDGGAVVRAQSIEGHLHDWGQRLYADLFSTSENMSVLKQLLESPEPRELTIATDKSVLLRLPWELLADDAGRLAERISVRRQLEQPSEAQSAEPRQITLPLRLLYIVSRPADTGFIDPRMTAKSLFDALDPLGAAVQIDFCRPPTLARMEEMLREAETAEQPYDVVHFDGHGTYIDSEGIGALCFEKSDASQESQTDLVRADRLGSMLATHKIPLVVLEACRSATIDKMSIFRSVAPRLIQAGINSVLSMGHAVHVKAAEILLKQFYIELARGATIGHAVAQGRKALVTNPWRWIESGPNGRTIELQDSFLPHLYQRDQDVPLLPPKVAANQPLRQYDIFLSHNHNDSSRVESLARLLTDKFGLRVWLDKWECVPGKLEPQCEVGIRDSRFTVVAGSKTAIKSKWVAWEIAKHKELNPEENRLLPIKLEPLKLPADLNGYLWVDFTDPNKDLEMAAYLTGLIRSADAADARKRRGFRPPQESGQPGSFPRPPQYGFHGRARELYELEQQFRSQRGIVLHAMGGMGKTTLATEAANWWTRSGLFRDGACFVSFEQFTSAERVVQLFGSYCEGPKFDQLPATEQRRRAIELFRKRQILLVWDNFESVLPQFEHTQEQRSSDPNTTGSQATDSTAADSPVQFSVYTDDERRRLAELFQDLTESEGSGRLLVTCRPGDTGLPGAGRKELHGLARPDSLWLLHRILERDGLSLNDDRFAKDQLEPLLVDLADHPLSLELVGPHLKRLTPAVIREDFGKLLASFENLSADQGRNKSLLASLEFSRRHLSPAARAALPWLGLFSGGVFEQILLSISQISLEDWAPIRVELQGIALLRVDDTQQINNRPYLRFHPTLATASADASLKQKPETRQRFVGVYLAVMQMLDKMLDGSQSWGAMEILNREEANYRMAVRWAVEERQLQAAALLGNTLRIFLARSGRLRERDAWVEWLRAALTVEENFSVEAAEYERTHAWTLLTNGDQNGALDKLQALIERLKQTTEFDPAFQLAGATTMLGRVFYIAGAAAKAVPNLREAVGQWERLVERAGGSIGVESNIEVSEGQEVQDGSRLTASDADVAKTELGNLSAALGDLANALKDTGKHDQALTVAEKALAIASRLGNQRNLAAGHGQIAQILMAVGRYDEADARYELALSATRKCGDKELEGTTLQNQGSLADDRGQFKRAVELYQQALQRFQQADNKGGMMQTFNLLGTVEAKSSRFAEARAWFEKSRELALELQDQAGIGQAAQNIGIVCQKEGEAARERGDEAAAQRHFESAKSSVDESLRIDQDSNNKPGEALSLIQLARIHLRLGDLEAAEKHAQAARVINESLGLKEVVGNYNTLFQIATARGDSVAAAEWTRKRDDMLAELERRARGGGSGESSSDSVNVSAQMLQALQQLTIACARAGLGGEELNADAEEALTTLDGYPQPFPEFANHLRQLASCNLPPIPDSLPPELQAMLTAIGEAIREAQNGNS